MIQKSERAAVEASANENVPAWQACIEKDKLPAEGKLKEMIRKVKRIPKVCSTRCVLIDSGLTRVSHLYAGSAAYVQVRTWQLGIWGLVWLSIASQQRRAPEERAAGLKARCAARSVKTP